MQRNTLRIVASLLAGLVLGVITFASDESPKPALPKVVLVGDSIRLGYAPTVEKLLAGKADVASPKANGGDSANVLKHLDEWVIREQPAVVHFNCGIHDAKKFKAQGQFQVSPEQYEARRHGGDRVPEVVYCVAASLDGCITIPDGGVTWLAASFRGQGLITE